MDLLVFLLICLLLLFIFGIGLYFIVRIYSDLISWRAGALYVGIPLTVARAALTQTEPSPTDTIFDLGCGDGRVLFLALREFGLKKAVGYEIAVWPYFKARIYQRLQKLKPHQSVEVHRANLFEADLSGASLIFLYLMPEMVKRLSLKIKREVRPHARIIIIERRPKLSPRGDFKIKVLTSDQL